MSNGDKVKISDRDWELLNGYLDGELSEEVRLQVQGRLAIDPLLAQELERLEQTKSQMGQLQGMIAFEDQLAKATKAKKAPKWHRPAAYAIAASLLLAVSVSYLGIGGSSLPGLPDQAGSLHAQLSKQDFEMSPTDLHLVRSAARLAGLSAPDLTGARLFLVNSQILQHDMNGQQILLHYRGVRGCSLSLLAQRKDQDVPLSSDLGNDGLDVSHWAADGWELALVSRGMDQARLSMIRDYLRDSIHRQFNQNDPILAELAQGDQPPCA